MILEVAVLDVKPGQSSAFERDFARASDHYYEPFSTVDRYTLAY